MGDMIFLSMLLALAIGMSIESVREMLRDGRGPTRPPGSHFQDPRFQGPGAS